MYLKVANKMSVQELCDYSVKAMVKQGGRCMKNGECEYENDKGNRCAIGHITNPRFHKGFGNMGVPGIIENQDGKGLPKPVTNNIHIFRNLQNFHDNTGLSDVKSNREMLTELGIDTSGSHWQAWVDLQS